ncbi:heptaprenyl diphosphate synthase component II [Bacillus fonticola]|uniref:heptaprenyl diphosphate synthase component II n=1 Tax=Bacillus fonticola TaxID=2728853 RepID=UPI001473E69E|nr:heptaprenyl diphosphate synthase component II [Bacillus fonticola]
MKLNVLYSFMQRDLQKIERALEEAITAQSPVLHDASLHLLQAGGKRIRPVFVLLAGQFGTYDFERMKQVAVALECIHMASLVHDDVIDDAVLRRGEPTIKAKWDNRIAMYTGDYIFAQSLQTFSTLQSSKAHEILAHTIVEVCVGEIDQIEDKYRYDQTVRDYLRRIKRKTALLIASSCQLGALAAGVEDEVHETLYKFGYYVGMAYQITDDLLDLTGTEEELGKPAGSDLWQGNLTLPVLYALEHPTAKTQVKKVHPNITKEELTPIIAAIKGTDALDRSYELSQRYLKKAHACLDRLPNNRANKTFRNIANYIGKRKF